MEKWLVDILDKYRNGLGRRMQGLFFVSSDCRSKSRGNCKSNGSEELAMDYCPMWKYGIEFIGTLKPPEYRFKTIQADYESMKDMVCREIPIFGTVMETMIGI